MGLSSDAKPVSEVCHPDLQVGERWFTKKHDILMQEQSHCMSLLGMTVGPTEAKSLELMFMSGYS